MSVLVFILESLGCDLSEPTLLAITLESAAVNMLNHRDEGWGDLENVVYVIWNLCAIFFYLNKILVQKIVFDL